MRSSVTGIIHNGENLPCSVLAIAEVISAWRVDFNLALTSFESSLAAVRSLVDFALSSHLAKPPRIVFTSSVSVLRSKLARL
jgi:hypothetical protein